MASPVDTKEKPEVTAFKDDLFKQAERVVLEVFPQKILELTKCLKDERFSMSPSSVHCDTNIPSPSTISNGPLHNFEEVDLNQPLLKKRKLETLPSVGIGTKQAPIFSGHVPVNQKLVEIADYIKPEIIQLMDNCSMVRFWIQLRIPKIEDGNNFGVGIQEEILTEVTKGESDAGNYLDQIASYFSSRGRILSRAAKYPHLDDYRRAIQELDEKAYLSFRLIFRDLRNIYAVLYDCVLKNFERIVNPRSSNSSALY